MELRLDKAGDLQGTALIPAQGWWAVFGLAFYTCGANFILAAWSGLVGKDIV